MSRSSGLQLRGPNALCRLLLLAVLLSGLIPAPAFAGTADEIGALPILDALNRTESPLSNNGKWFALAWDTSTSGHNTGRDTEGGWGPYDAFSVVNGAYWSPSTFSDKTGDAAVITMNTSPGIAQRYMSLWLDMEIPGSSRSGYALRWTLVTPSTNTYSVTLSKWSGGNQTVLASNGSLVIAPRATLAISDTGGTVSAWQGAAGSLTSILSASDSTYASGYAGVEGAGNNSRLANFKAGNLTGTTPDTTISAGPKGIVVPNVLFSFTASEGGASFECSLDGAAYGACTPPKNYQGLAEGIHTFRVRAIGAGGADATPAERSFGVIQAAKAVANVPVLDNLERQEVPLATGKWSKTSWAASIGGAWLGSYRGYGSSGGLAGAYWNPTNFNDAGETLLVSGNVGTGAAPEGQYLALWLDMPNPGSARSGYEARFTGVNGSASNYKVELSKWVSGTRTVLASTSGFSLAVGTTMALTETSGGSLALWTGTSSLSPVLTASDATYTGGYAGLEVNGGAGTTYNFRAGLIDLQAPDTTIQTGPSGTVSSENVLFSFTASEGGASFECSLDGAAYGACTSPKNYPSLSSGMHIFRVRAVDIVGDQDETPAERSFRVDTTLNRSLATTIYSSSYRTSSWDVASGGGYNYAPSVMLDGKYRMWWCGGIAGDHILYAESSSVNGPYHARGSSALYQDVLQPSPGSNFDGSHTCDPSVIRVHGTYYMYFGGLTEPSIGGTMPTQIGVASSPDGITWTKLNGGNPIVSPRNPGAGGYGAGQPSAAFVDGYFYLMYTDTSGLNGGNQYAIRSTDPTFQNNVEIATEFGFVPRTAANMDIYVVSQSFSPDWQYSDALQAWIVLSNQDPGKTFVRFLSKDLSYVLRTDLSISPVPWKDGPGIVSTPDKHALASANGECQRITVDFVNAASASEPPDDLRHFGVDLNTSSGCSALSSGQIADMFNGYGLEVPGLPLTVDVEKTRLQFALAAPAQDITNNFIATTSEVFNAIPYGASLYSGSSVIGATGKPAAFVLDNSIIWPVSSGKIITDNNSSITMVPPSTYDLYQVGPSLYEVPYTSRGAGGYRLVSRHSGKCMSLSENNGTNGTAIIQWSCSKTPTPADGQVFSFVPSVESFNIKINSSGKCLDVTGASTADGAWAQEYDCLGASQTNQLWSIVPISGQPGWYALIAKHSGKCADVTGESTQNGARIQQWTCTWGGNQQWRLEGIP